MMILIACEESQRVCTSFRNYGFEAFSCDIQECSGNHKEWHIKADVTSLLNGDTYFTVSDGTEYYVNEWDCVIAFPPCTDLAVSGAKYFDEKRKDGRQQKSIEFFLQFTKLKCPWSIENPVGIMSTYYRKPDQIIQPWQFGHGETKKTCLWLNKLPALKPTLIVEGREQRIWKMPPSENRAKERSKTYWGIAEAMGRQWGDYLKGV